ncbi:MAG: hypothetical protein U5P41_14280 [Gammaproteobacteria bacterium]|nr:hypothetical protein [Gammaproteobacteria bacterium]
MRRFAQRLRLIGLRFRRRLGVVYKLAVDLGTDGHLDQVGVRICL